MAQIVVVCGTCDTVLREDSDKTSTSFKPNLFPDLVDQEIYLFVDPCATCIENRYDDGYFAGYSAGLIKGFETPPLEPGNANSNVNTIGCEICRGNPNTSFICPRCGQTWLDDTPQESDHESE